ncbi:MAG: DUF5320 domain-containing protein [Candidatus Omnitrophota bacterium]
MPGFDGTGPRGQGPFTGGGRGYCAGYPVSGYMNSAPGRGSFGYGRGFGRGYGRGQGFGWRRMASYAYGVNDFGITPRTETEFLKEQVKFMQDEIQAINQRIKELNAVKEEEETK